MFDWSLYKGEYPWIPRRTIYMVRHGSHAYGTNVDGSDEDFRGVAIAPTESYLGIGPEFEQFVGNDPDISIFELRKFVRLCVKCNPNVLETLFVDESDMLEVTQLGRELLDMRNMFLSRKVFEAFGGYARGQMRKLLTGAGATIAGTASERKPARAEWVAKYGYDTKFACHLIRLLRVGKEILSEGVVRVRRPDADELKDIRLGNWTFERVMDEAAKAEFELKEAFSTTELPKSPDLAKIDRKVVDIVRWLT